MNVENFSAAIAPLFPGIELNHNKIREWKCLGGMSYVYDFSLAAGYANIFHNARGLIRLSIEHSDARLSVKEPGPVYVEANLLDHNFRAVGVKFRKINAKNAEEAMEKVVAWFAKNAPAIMAVKS